MLEDPAIEKIGQNLKYDMIVLRGGGRSSWPAWPSTRWSPATCSTPAGATTTSTSWPRRYLHHETIKISELIGTGKNQRRMDEVPVAPGGRLRRRGRLAAAAAAADPGRAAGRSRA